MRAFSLLLLLLFLLYGRSAHPPRLAQSLCPEELMTLNGRLLCGSKLKDLFQRCPPPRALQPGAQLWLQDLSCCRYKQGLLPARIRLTLGIPISVNRASTRELEALPGIGPYLARQIRQGRPFKDALSLERVKGIGRKRRRRITPFLSFQEPRPFWSPPSASSLQKPSNSPLESAD